MFVYRLALALGQPNPDAMLARMPQRVLNEWMLYSEMEPWGPERADWRSAMIAHVVAESHRGRKGRRTKIADFFPKFKRRRRKPATPQDGLRAMMNLAAHFGVTIRDERPDWKKAKHGSLD